MKVIRVVIISFLIYASAYATDDVVIRDRTISGHKANVDKVGSEYGLTTDILQKGLQVRIQYGTAGNADGHPEYVGYADPAATDGELKWRIIKITYDADGPTGVYWANQLNTYTLEWDEADTYDYSP